MFFNFLCYADGVKLKNNLDGIHLTTLRDGRPSGEAYVELATSGDLDLAVKKDRDHMGHRYIEGNIEEKQMLELNRKLLI